MNAHSYFATADSYLNVQWRESRSPWSQKAVLPFVTISRESGSGGTSLARALARALNSQSAEDISWNVYDGNLVKRMLSENHLSSQLARFLPEDRVSELNSSVGELVGLHPSLWELTRKTVKTMAGLAREGHAILVGRGANFATADVPNGLHVRLVASPEHRARYISSLYGLSEREAFLYNAKRDAAARRYVATIYGRKITEESAYDLVINTERISIAEAVMQIAALVRARSPRSR
ncbi:MAG: cytidylate kinase-like family protein [Nibricoccus sp.]